MEIILTELQRRKLLLLNDKKSQIEASLNETIELIFDFHGLKMPSEIELSENGKKILFKNEA